MIVILAHTHPSLTSGGAEISAYTLYRGLRALDVACAFVALCPEPRLQTLHLETDGEYVVAYPQDGYDDFYHLADPPCVDEVLALLDRLRCTTAVFHHFLNFGANAIRQSSRRPGRRTLLVLHEFLAICHHHGQMVTRPALRLCEAASPASCTRCFPDLEARQFSARRDALLNAFHDVAHFIAPSRFLRQRFAAWGLAAERISVVENGVPRMPAPESRPPRSPGARVTVGYFGQINPFKGVDLLLDALDLIRLEPALASRLRLRVHGPLVGQTPEFAARFEREVARRDLLEYVGPYENERVFDLMRDSDYVLMASKWWENSPVVIQEAYACGRPLIVPGIGGMKEKVVDGLTGLHFRAGDPADLVRALHAACEEGMRERLCAGLPPVLDAQGMARAYLALIATLPVGPVPATRVTGVPGPLAPKTFRLELS